MFRHPNYYKNLRKLARNRDSHVRPISGSADSATDQAISPKKLSLSEERSTGPGLKLPGPRPISNANKGLIHRRQAASHKLQAPSLLSNKPQASSPEQQASSFKPQASSSKILDPS